MSPTPSFSFDLILVLRIIQAILALLILILASTVISYFNTHTGVGPPPRSLIFTVFTSTLSLLISLPYNTFATHHFTAYTNRYSSMAVELTTMIFWFASWISVAVYLGSISVCRGSICGAAKAAVVLSTLEWILFCVSGWMPVYYTFFDSEHANGIGLGSGNSRLGMSGAERISAARMRREAANNERVRAERAGEKTGVVGGLERMFGIGKVRMENVVAEWRMKAGAGGSGENHSERGSRRSEMMESRYPSPV